MKTKIEELEERVSQMVIPQLQMVIGLWVSGQTYWLHNQTEKLITREQLTLKIKQEYLSPKVRKSHISITNHDSISKDVKLIVMHRYVQASKDHFTFISPSEQVIFHLANKKVFLVNGQYEGNGMQQATIQPFWNINTNLMWECSTRGLLKYQPMAKGLAVSMFTLAVDIPSNETKKASTWTIFGETKVELANLNKILLKNTLAFPFKK